MEKLIFVFSDLFVTHLSIVIMEAASLAIGIATLYTTCRDCYKLLTTMKTAEAKSSAHLRDLAIQQSTLNAWGFHWQIQKEDGREPENYDRPGQKRTKLHEYLLSNQFKAEGVFNTLSALADTLSNKEKLTKRYGIQLRPAQVVQDVLHSTDAIQLAITTIEDVEPVISEIKSRLPVLNRFKWALKDKNKFKTLIADLRSHSDSLYRLCPENALESMNIYLTMECLARQESPADLKFTSRVATQQAEIDGRSSVREGYKLLASTANLKASVHENRGGEQADDKALTSIDEKQREMRYLGKGVALFEEQVVYVEMREYRGPPPELTSEQKMKIRRHRKKPRMPFYDPNISDSAEEGDEPITIVRPADPKLRTLIKNFVHTFRGSNMMESVYGLEIAGTIDHTDGEHEGHCSILYKLPGTIGVQSLDRPAENLKPRAPVTLQSLLGTKQKQGIRSTLGARFELARKLVRAVCLLHSSGWLHKNIRAASVMFFPEHVSALHEDRYETNIEIDVSQPILMGYIFSRPDDVITRIDSPSTPATAADGAQHVPSRARVGTQTSTIWDGPMDVRAKSRRRTGAPRSDSIYGRDMLGSLGLAVPEQTKEINISGFTLDYYQHPAKHADPQRMYCHAYDVYSLGILLLEVGLWEKLKDYKDYGEDHYELRRLICKDYLDRLRWACGETYADVVLGCLMMNSSNDEVGKASKRELCARIVADLEGCRA